MLTVYKNIFYANATAFKEIYPPGPIQNGLTQEFLLTKPKKSKIDQVRFGVDFNQPACASGIQFDVNITLRTFDEPKPTNRGSNSVAETIWVTFQLPNKRHRDWILTRDQLRWEYSIENYGYTGYLFTEIHRGPSNDKLIGKEFNVNKESDLWVYECTSNRKKQRSEIITEKAPELIKIFDLGDQLFKHCDQINMDYETSAEQVHNGLNSAQPLLTQLIGLMVDFDLPTHPIFETIHQMQCYVHDVEDMFKVEKLWEKKAEKSIKKDAIKVSHIKKQSPN
jgi:hypothetical protein